VPRLFVAIDFPDDIKDRLVALQDGVPGARWVRRPQMHLTLRFIGEVNDARGKEIRSALATVESESFTLTLRGVGQFPKRGQPRVLWVGVDDSPALIALYEKVERALESIGVEPDDRPFSVHITLARLKKPPPRQTVETFMDNNRRFQTDTIPVSEFILYSSLLSPQGPTYTREGVYPLSG
jgi:2'-5' RNA ligase